MERKDFKMLVSYEEAKEVLQILFDNGYHWRGGGDTDMRKCTSDIKALHVVYPKVSYWSSLIMSYSSTNLPIITYDEFKSMNFTVVSQSTSSELITTDIMFKFIEYYMDHLNDEKTPQELFKDWKV